ncbi:MAG: Spy/CpxP family protein refolding chaperone [Hyphomicrobiales bacterium]
MVLLFGFSAAAEAQTPQPYAGMQTREVKSLSPSQLDDLRQGRGMGLALPAELNGYPGPAHVLELADKLSLSAQQRERMQSLFSAMKAEAIPLGEALIAQETELDRQFASRSVTPVTLAAMTQTIGGTQGALRAAHLKYHLSTLETLTPEQLQQYAKLRGYGDNVQQHEHQRRH